VAGSDHYIVGFSDSVHDRCACVFRGTEPLVAIEEERLTRQRFGLDFGHFDRRDASVFAKLDLDGGSGDDHGWKIRRLVDYCLAAAGIAESDVSLWIGNSLHTAFPLYDRAVFLNHHLAHASSAFFGSGAAQAAVLVIDGYGDSVSGQAFETVSIYRGEGSVLECLHRTSGVKDGLHLDNSAGILYRIGTLLSGFGVVDEGKAMGLAGHGQPGYLADILEHMTFGPGEVAIDNEAIWKSLQGVSGESIEQRADVAASFQAALEQVVVFYARLAHRLTGCDVLCLAGGVALNCVANQKVLDTAGFPSVWAFPAAADNGVAMGAAYYGAHVIYGGGPAAGLQTAYLGRRYARHETVAALRAVAGFATVEEIGPAACAERAAHHVAEGDLVMWFQEGSELGPRALGHRSIFGDPRSLASRHHINDAVKSREPFRPLAPIVPEERVGDWFDCGRSPFMLFTPTVYRRTRQAAPAIVHADGTARVQTVSRADNPEIHAMLVEFERLTGLPLMINTSFNLRGEPIVETPDDAVRAFAESPVTVLCIDGFHVEKEGQA